MRNVAVFVIRCASFVGEDIREELASKLREEVLYEEVEIEVIQDRVAPGMGTNWLLNPYSPTMDAARESRAEVIVVLGLECVAKWLSASREGYKHTFFKESAEGELVYCLPCPL